MKHSHIAHRWPLRFQFARWPRHLRPYKSASITRGTFRCGCPYLDIELLGYDLNISYIGWNGKGHRT